MSSSQFTGAAQGAFSGFATGAATGIPHLAGIGALIGGITGFFGGSKQSGGSGAFNKSKIKDALKATNRQELATLKEQYALGIQAQELALNLYDDERNRLYDQALKDYASYTDIQKSEYNTAVDLYKDSIDQFYQRVDLNNISATMAMNDAGRLLNDRRFELGINKQQIFINDSIFKAQSQITDSLIQSQMASSIDLANLNAKSIENQISTQLAVGSAELQAQEFSIASDMANLSAQGEAALAQGELKMDDILLNLDRQIAQADTAQQLLRLNLDETRANAAIQTDEARRSGLLAESAQIAKGQSGRSAAKSAQAIAFQSQQAQALLASAIVRADSKYLVDKNSIVKQLEFAREEGKNRLEAAAIEADLNAAQMSAAGLNMMAQGAQLEAQAQSMAGAVLGANLQLDQLSVDLLASQERLHSDLMMSQVRQAEAAAMSSLSLSSIAYAQNSATEQNLLDKERIGFDLYQANLAAASQVLDKPVMPTLAEPPTIPPPLVLDPIQPIDWNSLKELGDTRVKAGMATNFAALDPGFSQLQNTITSIGSAALDLASAFKQPPPVISASQLTQAADPLNFGKDMFGTGFNNSFSINSGNQLGNLFTPTMSSEFALPTLDINTGASFTSSSGMTNLFSNT